MLSIAFVFVLFACGDNTSLNSDYVIFGSFAGECGGEACVETFKLTDDKLYEDQKDNYNGDEFEWLELSNEKFDQVKDIRDAIPMELIALQDSTFGCPDCYDQGGVFIQVKESDEISSWRIDSNKNDIPDFLHNLIDAVFEKVSLLQ